MSIEWQGFLAKEKALTDSDKIYICLYLHMCLYINISLTSVTAISKNKNQQHQKRLC